VDWKEGEEKLSFVINVRGREKSETTKEKSLT
jgi:hypothetical protein